MKYVEKDPIPKEDVDYVKEIIKRDNSIAIQTYSLRACFIFLILIITYLIL